MEEQTKLNMIRERAMRELESEWLAKRVAEMKEELRKKYLSSKLPWYRKSLFKKIWPFEITIRRL